MTNKTPTERAAEAYPFSTDDYDEGRQKFANKIAEGNRKAYLQGDHDRQVIADAEYKELQDKGFKLLNEVNELMVENNRLRAWISVEERLPDFAITVLAIAHNTPTTAWYDPLTDEWFTDRKLIGVTHWLPVPSPPELLNDKKI